MTHIFKFFLAASICAIYLTLHLSFNASDSKKGASDDVIQILVLGGLLWCTVVYMYLLHIVLKRIFLLFEVAMLRYKMALHFFAISSYMATPVPSNAPILIAKYFLKKITGASNDGELFSTAPGVFFLFFLDSFLDGFFSFISSATIVIFLCVLIKYANRLFNRKSASIKP